MKFATNLCSLHFIHKPLHRLWWFLRLFNSLQKIVNASNEFYASLQNVIHCETIAILVNLGHVRFDLVTWCHRLPPALKCDWSVLGTLSRFEFKRVNRWQKFLNLVSAFVKTSLLYFLYLRLLFLIARNQRWLQLNVANWYTWNPTAVMGHLILWTKTRCWSLEGEIIWSW